MNTSVARKHPPKYESCKDNERKKCKDCGCSKCGGKNDPECILICDEWQLGFHLKCVGLKAVPEDDEWFCPEFTYTGSGGRDLSGNKRTTSQSSDQLLTKGNAAIARNCNAKFDDKKGADAGDKWKEGKPIRVV